VCDDILARQSALSTSTLAVFVAKQDRSKVALMCGGGSGHEPAHAGFVGTYITRPLSTIVIYL
jgi:dihydroxyacetone kinase